MWLISGLAHRVLKTVMMNRRAHYQTIPLVIIIQLLAMLVPVLFWIGRKHPPSLGTWIGWFMAWPLFLVGLFLVGGLFTIVSVKMDEVKREHARKND